jgi:5-methyltetrahydrofolate--homocysteine methyltransferase
MTSPEEILQGLYDETLVGNAPRVLELTEEGLTLGMEPQTLLFDALIPSLEEVGARFERGDFFVPEMLIAGRAMAGAMERLRPLLAETGVQTIGKFLMGTVKGDVHDIGKNLVNIMLEGAGFEVIDLGVQVAPEKFVSAIEEHTPDIVGFSAFLTTTMPMFKANINALEKAGLREKVVVMVGGAPVTQEYADAVGADGYAADASATVKKAKDLLQRGDERVEEQRLRLHADRQSLHGQLEHPRGIADQGLVIEALEDLVGSAHLLGSPRNCGWKERSGRNPQFRGVFMPRLSSRGWAVVGGPRRPPPPGR